MPCSFHGTKCDGECQDPNVDNGMMTKVWGPPGWLFLHCITFGYPYYIDMENDKHMVRMEATKRFFYNVGYVLPCKYCRESYKEFMAEIPIDNYLESRKSLTKWLYKMHNKVNRKLGVPDCAIPSFGEVVNEYEAFRAKCSKTTEAERINNMAKGCVVPADGTTKKCFLRIIKTKKGDVTRRSNASENKVDSGECEYVFTKKIYLILTFIIAMLSTLVLIYIVLKLISPKIRKKILKTLFN
jgi:hypothetical protein